jgi:hypothetical protein
MQPVEVWNDEQLIIRTQVEQAERSHLFSVALQPGINNFQLHAETIYDQASERNISISVSGISVVE